MRYLLISSLLLLNFSQTDPQTTDQAATGQANQVRAQFSMKVNDLLVNFSLDGEKIVALKDQIAQVTTAAFDYYVKLFGGMPRQALGEEYSSIPIDIKQGAEWHGEVEGNHIYVSFDLKPDPFSQVQWRGILAHEIFHLWNAKSFRYTSNSEQWFNEGISQYYTLKVLKLMGAIDEKTFFFALQTFLQMYYADKGLGNVSMRAAGFNKKRHTGLVEGGGLAIALCLDITIRKVTKNEKSLDDLMRILFEEYNSTSKKYDMEEIIRIVKSLIGDKEVGLESLESFFRKYVDGTERIPISQHLQYAGLTVMMDAMGSKIEISKKNDPDELEQAILSGILGN